MQNIYFASVTNSKGFLQMKKNNIKNKYTE